MGDVVTRFWYTLKNLHPYGDYYIFMLLLISLNSTYTMLTRVIT
jgi:hypothetical protein